MLGGHGDTMVPVVEYSTVAGIPIPDLIKMGWSTQERIDAIVKRTRGGGGEIVALLEAPARPFTRRRPSGIEMAETYLKDKKRLLPCAVHLTGQYGVDDLYVGVPCVIGAGGVEKIVEIELNDEAKANFQVSVDAVKELLVACKAIDGIAWLILSVTPAKAGAQTGRCDWGWVPAFAGMTRDGRRMAKAASSTSMASARNGDALHRRDERPGASAFWQHREGVADGFTRKYGCKTLVWFEQFGDIELAIRREKQMKEWKRLWKLRVIEEMNPDWNDLFESLL